VGLKVYIAKTLRQYKFDVVNGLTLMDNPLFLTEQQYGPGDGQLHYYLFNYRASPIPGGLDSNNNVDPKSMGGVGMVML
jgi:glycylpeptide N-tetradecanoyltransferase